MENERLVAACIDYILERLDKDLTAQDVAGHFHYSPSYLGRIFRRETGESLYAFIRRRKLDQSATDLKLRRKRSVTDIGLDYGYSASNFSAAFRKQRRASPAEYRGSICESQIVNPFDSARIETFRAFSEYDAEARLCRLDDMPVVFERTIGGYDEIGGKWVRFREVHRERFSRGARMIERC